MLDVTLAEFGRESMSLSSTTTVTWPICKLSCYCSHYDCVGDRREGIG